MCLFYRRIVPLEIGSKQAHAGVAVSELASMNSSGNRCFVAAGNRAAFHTDVQLKRRPQARHFNRPSLNR